MTFTKLKAASRSLEREIVLLRERETVQSSAPTKWRRREAKWKRHSHSVSKDLVRDDVTGERLPRVTGLFIARIRTASSLQYNNENSDSVLMLACVNEPCDHLMDLLKTTMAAAAPYRDFHAHQTDGRFFLYQHGFNGSFSIALDNLLDRRL